jgi:ferredoxin
MINTLNKLTINKIGRDLTEYISSNTMNIVTKKVNPFIWTYDLKALVLDKNLENSGEITVTLLPNQHWKEAKTGQYIELKIFIEGKENRYSYPISSIKNNTISLNIKNSKKITVSNWLHSNLKIGMILEISGPLGEFNYYQRPTSGFPVVYFKQYNKQIQLTEADKGKSLLQIGIENGLNLEKGCKRGICGTCKLILHEGSVEGNKIGSAVYICSAFPVSESVVLGT